MSIEKTIITINQHKKVVTKNLVTFIKNVSKFGNISDDAKKRVIDLAYAHDTDKFDFNFLEDYTLYLDERKDLKFGTDEYYAVKNKYKHLTSQHHEKSKHHFQSYKNPNSVSTIHLLEMLADWKSASDKVENAVELDKTIEIQASKFHLCDDVVNRLKTFSQFFDEDTCKKPSRYTKDLLNLYLEEI